MKTCEVTNASSHSYQQIQHRAMQELKIIRRQELGMSIEEFANLLNVSWNTVKQWEGGRRSIIAPMMLSLWWGKNIRAALIAGRIFQKAFDGMFLEGAG